MVRVDGDLHLVSMAAMPVNEVRLLGQTLQGEEQFSAARSRRHPPPRLTPDRRILEQPDQLGNEGGVQAGVEFVGQEHRAIGGGFDDQTDEAKPHERAVRLVPCVEFYLPVDASVEKPDPEIHKGGPLLRAVGPALGPGERAFATTGPPEQIPTGSPNQAEPPPHRPKGPRIATWTPCVSDRLW